jgi:hypothetical protein
VPTRQLLQHISLLIYP